MAQVQLDHDQGPEGDAFVRLYEVQLKECIVKSIENTTESFELEEETLVETIELADMGFTKIERALSALGIREGQGVDWHLTEEEREENAMHDLIRAADYLQ